MARASRNLRTVSVVALVTVLVAGCARSSSDTSSLSSGNATSASAQAVATPDADAVNWHANTQYVYELKLSTDLALGKQAKAFDFDLSAELVLIASPATAGTTTLFAALRGATIKSRVSDTQPEFDKVQAQVEGTGWFVTLSNGQLREMYLPRGLSVVSVGIFREIASRFQFAGSRAGSREALESDSTGKYVAEYVPEPGAKGTWKKRKLRYASALGVESSIRSIPTRILPEVAKSEGTFQLADDGRPALIRARDEIKFTSAQTPLDSHLSISLSLLPMSQVVEARDWSALTAKMEKMKADEPYGKQASVESLDEARIRGMTFRSVVLELEKMARSSKSSAQAKDSASAHAEADALNAKSTLFVALAAIFRRHPETITLASAKVKRGSAISDVLIDALGSSGASQAHEALSELAGQQRLDPTLRQRAVTALARTSAPSSTAIGALKGMLRDDPFKTDALYGLGTYCRRMRDVGNVQGAEELGAFLTERLRMAGNEGPLVAIALTAISNSGYDGALAHVLPFLTDARDPVRAAAVHALQSMRDARASDLIAERVRADASSAVRIAAMDAARVRAPNEVLMQAVEVAAKAEDPRVRYRAVDLIIEWLPVLPALRPTLAKVASSDAEEQVRVRARGAL